MAQNAACMNLTLYEAPVNSTTTVTTSMTLLDPTKRVRRRIPDFRVNAPWTRMQTRFSDKHVPIATKPPVMSTAQIGPKPLLVNYWSTSNSGTGTTGIAVATSTGTDAAIGDTLIAYISSYNTATLVAPSGWSVLVPQFANPGDANMLMAVFYKIAVAADVNATFTFTNGAVAAYFSAVIHAWRNVGGFAPVGTAQSVLGGLGAIASSITLGNSTSVLLFFQISSTTSFVTAPAAGMFQAGYFATSGTVEGLEVDYVIGKPTGATGVVQGTGVIGAATSNNAAAVLIALNAVATPVAVLAESITTTPKVVINVKAIANFSSVSGNAPLYYLPIVLTNSQSGTTAANLPIKVTVNSNTYSSLYATGLNNANWQDVNGNILFSWLETGETNTSTNSTYWINLGANTITGSGGTFTVYQVIYGTGVNVFNTSNTGAEPNYSGTWGQYDVGANLFTEYQGKVWTGFTTHGGTWDSTHGYFEQTDTTGGPGSGGGAALLQTNSYSATGSYVLEMAFQYSNNAIARVGIAAVMSTSPNGYRFIGENSSNAAGWLSFLNDGQAWVAQGSTLGVVSTNYALSISNGAGTWSGTFYSGLTVAGTSLATLAPTAYSSNNSQGTNTGYVGISATLDSGTDVPVRIYWFRLRSYPPSGVLPASVNGVLTSVTGPVAVKAQSISTAQSHLQVARTVAVTADAVVTTPKFLAARTLAVAADAVTVKLGLKPPQSVLAVSAEAVSTTGKISIKPTNVLSLIFNTIARRSSGTSSGTFGASASVSVSLGTPQNNDIVIVAVNINNVSGVTPPSGYTSITNVSYNSGSNEVAAFYHIWHTGDATSGLSFTFFGTPSGSYVTAAYSGINILPTLTSGQAGGSSTTSANSAGGFPTTAQDMAIFIYGAGVTTFATPSTGSINVQSVNTNGAAVLGDILLTSAGIVSQTINLSPASAYGSIQVQIAPASTLLIAPQTALPVSRTFAASGTQVFVYTPKLFVARTLSVLADAISTKPAFGVARTLAVAADAISGLTRLVAKRTIATSAQAVVVTGTAVPGVIVGSGTLAVSADAISGTTKLITKSTVATAAQAVTVSEKVSTHASVVVSVAATAISGTAAFIQTRSVVLAVAAQSIGHLAALFVKRTLATVAQAVTTSASAVVKGSVVIGTLAQAITTTQKLIERASGTLAVAAQAITGVGKTLVKPTTSVLAVAADAVTVSATSIQKVTRTLAVVAQAVVTTPKAVINVSRTLATVGQAVTTLGKVTLKPLTTLAVTAQAILVSVSGVLHPSVVLAVSAQAVRTVSALSQRVVIAVLNQAITVSYTFSFGLQSLAIAVSTRSRLAFTTATGVLNSVVASTRSRLASTTVTGVLNSIVISVRSRLNSTTKDE